MSSRRQDFPDLTTPRLRLRRFVRADAAALHCILSDKDVLRYWNTPATECEDHAAHLIERWLGRTTSPYEHLSWAVTLVNGGRLVGLLNYHSRDAHNQRLEIGYAVARSHQRMGIGTEAVGALVEHCTTTLGVHRISALIMPGNAASIALVTSLGFTCEGGPLTDYWCVDGTYRSPMIYARISPSSSTYRSTD